MDSFTERMMERAKARKDKLRTQLQNTSEEANMNFRPNATPLKELNFGNSLNVDSSHSLNVEFHSRRKVDINEQFISNVTSNLRSPLKSSVDALSPSKNLEKSPGKIITRTNSPSKMNFKVQSPRLLNLDVESPNKLMTDNRSPSKESSGSKSPRVGGLNSPRKSGGFLPSPKKIVHISPSKIETDSIKSTTDSEGESTDENVYLEQDIEVHQPGGIRDGAKQKLKKLGALYGDRPSRVSSPIQQTEERFAAEDIKIVNSKPSARSARLAALASQINQWEDDLKHVPSSSEKTVSKSSDDSQTYKFTVNSPTKHTAYSDKSRFSVTPHQFIKSNYQSGVMSVSQPPKSILKTAQTDQVSLRNTGHRNSPEKIAAQSPKKIMWDKSSYIAKSPVRTEIRTNPLSSYSPTKNSPIKQQSSPFKGSPRPANIISQRSPNKGSPRMGSVLQKAIMYEAATSPTKTVSKDPAELTLAERKALFERNKGDVILPKVPFGQPLPAVKSAAVAFNSGVQATSTIKTSSSENKAARPVASSSKGSGLSSKLAVFEQLEKTPVEKKYNDERQQDLEMLRNRWDKFKNISPEAQNKKIPSPSKTKPIVTDMQLKINTFSPPNPPPIPESQVRSPAPIRSSISPIKKPDESEAKARVSFPSVKPIIVSPPKPGNLYPNLSDVEIESENDAINERNYSSELCSDQQPRSSYSSVASSELSLGQKIVRAAQENQQTNFNRKRRSSSSDLSSCGNKVPYSTDDFLDEAFSDDSSPSPSKQSRDDVSSVSLSLTPSDSVSMLSSCEEIENCRQPLTHTVSFYRKLQNQNAINNSVATPVKKFVHKSDDSNSSNNMEIEAEIEREQVQKKIQELSLRISTEQTVISQATQALNLCFNTVEFSNSTEQVEAERLLLLATHKRQAAVNELQRLKVEGTLRPNKADACFLKDQGSLTISEIMLPIKLDAIRMAAREEMCHHLICLLKCDEVVYGTSLITAAGKHLQQNSKGTMYIQFTNKITFPHLYSDFKITVEVYDLIARSKEVLPHDIKYHITSKKDNSKLRITPKKHKADSRLIMPVKQSPAGPGAVRTSNFSMVGYIVFSLREINRTQFTLNKVSYTSPLEGVVQLKMNCELSPSMEHRGFLTMFEDVSGFGAWHRRWCLLKGENLSYWKYPEDETTKVPIDTIDLNSCTTKTVNVVSRDICARPNTFLLETIRPTRDEDIDSLVLVRHSNHTMIRHLLSADTKEERIEWCEVLNKALAILRAWGRK